MKKNKKADTHPDDPKVIKVHQVFAWPVLFASLGTVIGLFMSLGREPFGQIGEEIVMLASLVIVAESLMVGLVSGDKRRWLKKHWPIVLLSLVVVVLFVVGVAIPLHLMRLVSGFSASPLGSVLQHAKVLHVGEFGHAKEHVAESSKLAQRLHKPLEALISLSVPLYLVLALRDPESASRQLVTLAEGVFDGSHWRALLGVAVLFIVVVVAKRRTKQHAAGEAASAEAEPQH